MGIITILWEKWVEFRRDFYKITLSAMIAPIMYLLVFGMGIQTVSHGKPYLLYLIPGVVAVSYTHLDVYKRQEVANMIVFLCSDKASYITGQEFVVDGGNTIQEYKGAPEFYY